MNTPHARSYTVCTLDKHINCTTCSIAEKVDCSRHKPGQMAAYYLMVALFIVPALLLLGTATIISRIWWFIPVYLLYWIFYQVSGELFIRCRHCPFWDETSPTLECRINCGVPKLRWHILGPLVRYDPRPLAYWEKAAIQILSVTAFIIPMAAGTVVALEHLPARGMHDPALIAMAGFAVLHTAGAVCFLYYLLGRLCPTCVHFSCPNNHQPFHVIESYLGMNRYIREAWEKDLHKYSRRK